MANRFDVVVVGGGHHAPDQRARTREHHALKSDITFDRAERFFHACLVYRQRGAQQRRAHEAIECRADLVEDCGLSLNPAIDLGQIEGAFVQGQGWFTCEELWWDKQGRLRTVGPSTYKIPGSRDVPPVLNVKMLENAPAKEATIFRSKAVGEPPLMLATAIWTAQKDAIAAAGNGKTAVQLDAPATPERILSSIAKVKA